MTGLPPGYDAWILRGPPEDDRPECDYCGETEGLRVAHEGWGKVPPGFICEECFTGEDTGPCFDDLPTVEEWLDQQTERAEWLRKRRQEDGA